MNQQKSPAMPSGPLRAFEHSRKALAIYDQQAAANAKRWEDAESASDVADAEKADSQALEQLQQAFFEDTHEVNSREHCAAVPASDIRRFVERSGLAQKFMTHRQFAHWLKREHKIEIYHLESAGGGRTDRNRDHRLWHVEWSDRRRMQVELWTCTGSVDGKQACEAEARRRALEQRAQDYGITVRVVLDDPS